MVYSYGLPGPVIWATHILIGLLLVYVGKQIVDGKSLNNNIGMLFVVLGSLAAAYHSHLWFIKKNEN